MWSCFPLGPIAIREEGRGDPVWLEKSQDLFEHFVFGLYVLKTQEPNAGDSVRIVGARISEGEEERL